jgi:uncharacterized membrane protein
MSEVLREVVLIAATMTMGLMAGVFGIYGNAIMPGLQRTDDRTFIAAFQSIDRSIINPAFMVTFFGALALSALAALLHLVADGRPVLPWIASALVLYLFVFIVTIRVNVPRDNEIKAAGDVERMTDPHGARSDLTRPGGSAGTTHGQSPLPSRSACSPGRSSSLDKRSELRPRGVHAQAMPGRSIH